MLRTKLKEQSLFQLNQIDIIQRFWTNLKKVEKEKLT